MKELFLIRHAEAESTLLRCNDIDRKLTNHGMIDAKKLDNLAMNKNWNVDLILCSSSLRTRQTLEQMEGFSNGRTISIEESLYLATASEIIKIIESQSSSIKSLMIIGHNPGLHEAALALCEREESPFLEKLELGFPTAAVARIVFDTEDWHKALKTSGRIAEFLENSNHTAA